MTDIDRILAEELPPESATGPRHQVIGNVAPEQLTGARLHGRGHPPFSATSQPLDRAPISSAYRRRLTRERADAIADRTLELAEAGSIRHIAELADRLEGKPGVRIADGEWSPETSPQFAIWQQFANLAPVPEPDALEASAPADDAT